MFVWPKNQTNNIKLNWSFIVSHGLIPAGIAPFAGKAPVECAKMSRVVLRRIFVDIDVVLLFGRVPLSPNGSFPTAISRWNNYSILSRTKFRPHTSRKPAFRLRENPTYQHTHVCKNYENLLTTECTWRSDPELILCPRIRLNLGRLLVGCTSLTPMVRSDMFFNLLCTNPT